MVYRCPVGVGFILRHRDVHADHDRSRFRDQRQVILEESQPFIVQSIMIGRVLIFAPIHAVQDNEMDVTDIDRVIDRPEHLVISIGRFIERSFRLGPVVVVADDLERGKPGGRNHFFVILHRLGDGIAAVRRIHEIAEGENIGW